MEHEVARLSEGQRECLRMVYRHMETKEIARSLGISPDGVTQRIKTAMRILGVQRRRDAALILAQHEGTEPYPSLVYPPRDIAIAPHQATFGATTEGGRPSGSSGEAMREEQVAFEAVTLARRPALPLPIGGARPNDVGILKRLAWIAGITIGIALAFGALISGVEALTRLVWS
ncbi:MAG TPA: helix-turn-helix transcriptional regulator [Allosphingosinicella sp.]|jgi:DNA-binding CsgD family transcriptional regulator|nr:helix-turn-helix transcriptional regulator [Allosphingosinicella sp.]